MLAPGRHIELEVEKPAAGGRMIARHEGQVVLVNGAIPGERVVARIERVERRLAFATTVDVTQPSPDRRQGFADPACGGCVYSHIAYPRQLEIKAAVVADAFTRLGHVLLPDGVAVAGSPERGYRMRARFHVRDGRAGFYREGSHELCDPALTGQLADAAVAAVAATADALQEQGTAAESVELTENISGAERALAVELRSGSRTASPLLERLIERGSCTGLTVRTVGGPVISAGNPFVADPLSVLTCGRVLHGDLARRPESFFQANRYLVADLVTSVLDQVPAGERVLDLYAGVGLFAIALAGAGARRVTAVEGDRSSAEDLQKNARPFGDAVRVVMGSVEAHLTAKTAEPFATIVIDPPRVGVSRDVMAALVRRAAPRVVYVSCDPATMARDARRLLDGGYRLEALRAFDLFPNTPHVETVGVFVRE